ncbi:MarR family transcriptional regulator [Pediococcus ethanolidurans]|uniref:MarR family transcriptional regulator n=2 Tax=Pediococcus ethanolidurans TaxID=319653 RepID=A0A0R2K558_9LACO|nr:MarR family transcriptional regulator [Pediococcus ethanolidurans]
MSEMADVLREIGTIARALDSISNIEFKQYELTKGQYLYLVRICEHPGIIQERVADMLNVDRTTAARAIQKLTQNELIEKRMDENNKKNKQLYPTAKRLKIFPIIQRENKYSTGVALKGFTDEERKVAENLLSRMRKNVATNWNYVKKGNQRRY